MKVKELMSGNVIRIGPRESVEVAARTLAHYNIGVLPVCGGDGKLCGVLTDRDIVTRCLASGRNPGETRVEEIMTRQVHSVQPDAHTATAAGIMGRQQVRRLPVVENGYLCGMLSLGDLSQKEDSSFDAADALSAITNNISSR
jgi:CBS domain-containing protein